MLGVNFPDGHVCLSAPYHGNRADGAMSPPREGSDGGREGGEGPSLHLPPVKEGRSTSKKNGKWQVGEACDQNGKCHFPLPLPGERGVCCVETFQSVKIHYTIDLPLQHTHPKDACAPTPQP